MTDETPVVEPEQPENQEGEQDEEKTFSLEYVKQLRDEAAARRVELKELKQKQKEAEEAQLAQQEQWQTLAETRAGEIQELQPYKEQYEGWIASVKETNQGRIEAIPEQMRGLVPEFEDPVKLSTWLDANQQLLGKPLAPVMNGDSGGGQRPSEQLTLSPEELDAARKMGVDAKEYAKYRG